MKIRQSDGIWMLLVMTFLSGCAAAQLRDVPRAERAAWLPKGSTWIWAGKNSGSFGSGTVTSTFTMLGEQTWQGRPVMAQTDGNLVYYYDRDRRIVGSAKGDTPVSTYQPYEALYDWPLAVGKSWTSELKYMDHAAGQTYDLTFRFTVDAFEELTTPAGTFKVFRIRRESPVDHLVHWYNPELGLEMKRQWARFSGHRAGPGTNDREVVSYEVKR
jgi:hypothetical protein